MRILERESRGRLLACGRLTRRRGLWLGLLPVAAVLLGGAVLAQQPPEAVLRLDRTEFEARGRNEALLTVDRFGCLSVLATSKQGTALQLVDRMAGPGGVRGEAGKKDGRLDMILDAGTYKIAALSHEKGQGKLTLTARAYKELNAPAAPVLVENLPVEGRLEDFQQLSYWIQIPKRRFVYLEAQGRDLQDLRLWFEGNWLEDATPVVTERAPVSGRPETNCLIVADLAPGTYLLTAYGGPPKPWPAETGTHPFHLRYGLPSLDANARVLREVSPYGSDRYLIPEPANTFILQLPEKTTFRLEMQGFEPGDSLDETEATAVITKKSQDPECKIERDSGKKFRLVTVSGSPGEPYILQCFEKKESYTFDTSGTYWLETLHSGYLEDHIDATAILVSDKDQGPHVPAEASDVIRLGDGKSWARRFNLLEEETLFFFVEQAGDYEIRSAGTDAEFRFEPFMTSRPEHYKTPAFKAGSSTWPLDPGYWVLTLKPTLKGIAAVEVRKKAGTVPFAAGIARDDSEIKPGPAKGASLFPKVVLDEDHVYTLYTNVQEGVDHGVILRSYPLNLGQPLPVTLKPGAEIAVPFRASEAGRFSIAALPGSSFSAEADGRPCPAGCDLEEGPHEVRLKNTGARTQGYSLEFVPKPLLPGAPLPPLPTEVSARFTQFQALKEGAPLFVDFDRGEKKSVLLTVDSPGLYRIETSGLLATSCALRTRTVTKLLSDESGGVGRNCLVQGYLKPGEYQATFQALGRSKGHAGLSVRRSSVTDGGSLALGKDRRDEVPAGAAVEYTFEVPSAARCRVGTIGAGKSFRCRLDDRDGWPLITPGSQADLVRDFQPGVYRYMTLPWDVDTLRCTRVDPVPPPRRAEGRGPHSLVLNEPLENTWREPEEGAPRQRDLYDVQIPADVDAHLSLGDEQMQAYITRREDGAYAVVEPVAPGKEGWSGRLPAGTYRLEVECGRPNDRLPYSVLLSVDQLVPGLSREVTVPCTLEVSVSRESVVELSSRGTLDTRAELFTKPDERFVAEADDAYNDWNFRIARTLEPGQYFLDVFPVGKASGSTRVSMNAPEEVTDPALTLPFDAEVTVGDRIHVLPLAAPAQGGLVSVTASAGSFLGLLIEKVEDGKPRVLAQRTGRSCAIDVPVSPGGRYQIRLWSADHQSERAKLAAAFASPQAAPVEALRGGGTPLPASGAALFPVEVSRPGTFRISPLEGFSYSPALDRPLEVPPSDLIALPAGRVFLAWRAGGGARAQVERLTLSAGEEHAARLEVAGGEPWTLDVEEAAGAVSILSARGGPGNPGCAFLPRGGSSPVLTWSYALLENASCAVGLPGAASAVVWNRDPEGDALPGFDVSLSTFKPPSESERNAALGTTGGELRAGQRSDYALPQGPKRLDLDLEPGLLAFVWDGAAVDGAACAADGPVRRSLETSSPRLVLVNLGQEPALYSFSVFTARAAEPMAELSVGGLYEKVMPLRGTVTVRLSDALKGARGLDLFVAGDDARGRFMDESGSVYEGRRIPLQGHTGILTIEHGAGLVKAWIAAERDSVAARWGPSSLPPPALAEVNSEFPASGACQAFALSLSGPSVLHFDHDGAGAACLKRASGETLLVCEREDSCSFDYYLPPGEYLLGLRGLAGGTLSGNCRLASTPVAVIDATFGPETLLGGGESRTFAFALPEKGKVGIGVKASRESLECELLTREEKLLGRGIQQFWTLDAGTYLLRISCEPDSEPVRFTPAVVGLQKPDTGPPEEALREFLQSVGAFEEGE